MFENFIYTILTIAFAEIGDKTQFICLALSAKYKKPHILLISLALGSLLSHLLGSFVGKSLANVINPDYIKWGAAIIFMFLGISTFFEKVEEEKFKEYSNKSLLIAASLIFAISELSDKTMLATMALSAKYQNIILTTIGAIIGMLIADGPIIYLGPKIDKFIPTNKIRRLGAVIFIIAGLFMLF
jgi:putative Ca2+/H+ antiporter (TMEM165/GDT1 family)